MSRKHVYALALFFLSIVVLPLTAQEKPADHVPLAATPAARADALRDYLIGPQDILFVSILESPELSREVRVSGDGTISLPLLSSRVQVQGLTLGQAEELLKKNYQEGGILNQPNITVSVKEVQSKPVTVMGAVRNPGVFQVAGQMGLLRVLTQVGGVGEDAGDVVQIIRAGTTSSAQIIQVRLEELREGNLEANLPVYGGDTVNVLPAGAVYVVGAVNRPGRYLIRGSDQLTVLRLLALVEDLKRTAKPQKSVIIRKDPATGTMQEIPLDIQKILQRKATDSAFLPNDVLFVPESTGKKAMARGLESAVQLATSALLYGVVRQ